MAAAEKDCGDHGRSAATRGAPTATMVRAKCKLASHRIRLPPSPSSSLAMTDVGGVETTLLLVLLGCAAAARLALGGSSSGSSGSAAGGVRSAYLVVYALEHESMQRARHMVRNMLTYIIVQRRFLIVYKNMAITFRKFTNT